MRKFSILTMICIIVTFSPLCAQQRISGIGQIGPVKKLHTGFQFIEGPTADDQGNVYFTDIPQERIYLVDPKGKLSVFLEKSNHANGLMLNANGNLVACEMDGQVAVISTDDKSRKVLIAKHQGKRFNAPNDLVIDKQGGIYFTDPSFRAPKPYPQKNLAVYYLNPQGKVSRIINHLPNPNGIILSPDEKTLYVIPSSQADMMAYPVLAPGKIGKGRVFCKLKQPPKQKNTGGDGLTVDRNGNLYITSRIGIQIFNPKGKLLGVIQIPEVPANVTFGGADHKTLYVTARKSLYTVKMPVQGHQFARNK